MSRSCIVLVSALALAACDRIFPVGGGTATDAGPDLDRDDDGWNDEVDSCPAIANPDQHDEDGDLVGDVCDNCPHIANVQAENGDGDGVGDNCDDSGAFDCIALFDGFGDLDGWSDAVGTWMQIDDAAIQDAPAFADAQLLSIASVPDGYLYTQASVLEVGSTGGNVGLWSGATYTPGETYPDGIAVEAYYVTGADTILAVSRVVAQTPAALNMFLPVAPPHALVAIDLVQIWFDVRNPTWAATLGITSGSGGTSSMSEQFMAQPLPGATSRLGLRTHRARARFEHILVRMRGTAPCPPGVFP